MAYSGFSNQAKNTASKSFSPAMAASQRSLKSSYPLAVDSMITMVAGSEGTACRIPVSVSAFPAPADGQKAYSDMCTHCSVSERPTPFPPAVAQRSREPRPGFSALSLRSGLSNTSSRLLEALSIGRSSSGSSS